MSDVDAQCEPPRKFRFFWGGHCPSIGNFNICQQSNIYNVYVTMKMDLHKDLGKYF